MKKIIILNIILFLVAGCAKQDTSWTQEDKENSQHFFYSLESNFSATALSNEIGRGNQPKAKMTDVVSLRKVALKEANLLEDTVLLKANQELPEKFRNLYQKSLEYFIQAYEQKDNQASMRYSTLAEQWSNWYQENKRSIKIPE